MEEGKGRRHALGLLLDLVDRPAVALGEIVARPRWRWLLPVVLTIAAMVTLAIVSNPLAAERAQQVMQQQLALLSTAQAQAAGAWIDRFQQPAVLLATTIGAQLLGLALSWLIAAVILFFTSLIAGGDVTFSGLFSAMPWVWLPFALRDAIQAVYVLVKGTLIANQGLSYLVSTGNAVDDAQNLWYNVLARVDLFTIWHIVLVAVVLCVLPRFTKGKAFALTLVYVAVSLGLRLLPSVLSAALLPG
jgi:hypothetical protein